jgi:NAD(P)H-flavin reductase
MATAADEQVRMLPLSDRRMVAERTLEFRFAKPAGMTFKAGQFVDVHVDRTA